MTYTIHGEDIYTRTERLIKRLEFESERAHCKIEELRRKQDKLIEHIDKMNGLISERIDATTDLCEANRTSINVLADLVRELNNDIKIYKGR
jgi:hypothetical protein